MKRTFLNISIIGILLTASMFTIVPQLNAANDVGVNPPSGPPGTEFAFFATGFDDKEKLGYWFNSPDGKMYSNNTDFRIRAYLGRVDWSWRVPNNAMQGTWQAVIRGTRSKVEHVIPFDVFVYDPSQVSNNAATSNDIVAQNAQPSKGPPTERFVFFANGFDKSEQVAYWFTSPDGKTYRDDVQNNTVRSSDGRVDWSWKPPGDAVPGIWSAVVQGTESKVLRVVKFEIYYPEGYKPVTNEGYVAPRTSDLAVVPQVGLPGTTFAFYARGFKHNEKVGYWFNTPNGKIIQNRYQFVSTANNDRADWKWDSPSDAQQGIWSVVAKGSTSKIERVIYFEIGDPNHAQLGKVQVQQSSQTPTQSEEMPQNASDVAVEPLEGPPGSRFNFSAGGFPRKEEATFRAIDPSGRIFEREKFYVPANESGVVYWSWDAPYDAMYGVWKMVSRGVKTDVERTIYFRVDDPKKGQTNRSGQTNESDVAVDPLMGTPGTSFSFKAAGYPPRETILYWATDPNGKLYEKGKYTLMSDKSGVAYWSWKVPSDGAYGIWTMVGKGQKSQVQRSIFFEVIDPNASPRSSSIAQSRTGSSASQSSEMANTKQLINPSQVSVDPNIALPGSRFAFFATGFPPREKVTYWAIDPAGKKFDSSKYLVLSNTEGRADWNWKSPRDAKIGLWQMHAIGDKSQLEHIISFQVGDPSAPLPEHGTVPSSAQPSAPSTQSDQTTKQPAQASSFAVDPAIGPPGSRFRFFATGYPPREKVTYWAIDPLGKKYDHSSKYEVLSNEQGRADWNWKTPNDAEPGLWKMYAQGDKSQVIHEISFEVR